MTTLLSLLVKLGVDSRDLTGGLDDAEKKAEGSSKIISSSLGKIGDNLVKAGAVMTVGLTAPIMAMAAVAVKAASDMQETVNKVNVVFGEGAQGMIDWADTAAKTMGMSSQAALEAAGSFGAMFSAMGMTADQSYNMSQGLVQLAADLGSFNNIDPAVMLEKLRSGLVGETEPLRQIGILISEAAVQAKGLEMGLGGATGALSDQEKVLARYQLILDQTTLAQGDFGRTADGLANASRTLKATISDLAAKIGEALLPAVQNIVNGTIPLIEGFGKWSVGAQTAALGVGALLVVIGPLTTMIGGLAKAWGGLVAISASGSLTPLLGALGLLTTPVGWILALVGALILLGVTIAKFGPAAMETLGMWATFWSAVLKRALWEVENFAKGFQEAVNRTTGTAPPPPGAMGGRGGMVPTAQPDYPIDTTDAWIRTADNAAYAINTMGAAFVSITQDIEVYKGGMYNALAPTEDLSAAANNVATHMAMVAQAEQRAATAAQNVDDAMRNAVQPSRDLVSALTTAPGFSSGLSTLLDKLKFFAAGGAEIAKVGANIALSVDTPGGMSAAEGIAMTQEIMAVSEKAMVTAGYQLEATAIANLVNGTGLTLEEAKALYARATTAADVQKKIDAYTMDYSVEVSDPDGWYAKMQSQVYTLTYNVVVNGDLPGTNATGGAVPGGYLTWVGERGPELFVTPAAGDIIPNNQTESYLDGMGGGDTTSTTSLVTIPVTMILQGGATYTDGQNAGAGLLDYMRSQGVPI